MTEQPKPEKPPVQQEVLKKEEAKPPAGPAKSESPPKPDVKPAASATSQAPAKVEPSGSQPPKSSESSPAPKPSQPTPSAASSTPAQPAASSTPDAKVSNNESPAVKPPSPGHSSSTLDLSAAAKEAIEATQLSKGNLPPRPEGGKDETSVSSSSPAAPKVQRFPESGPSGQSSSSVQICPTCGHRNRPGVLVCDNCGTNLLTGSKTAVGTRDLKRDQEGGGDKIDPAQASAVETAGVGGFTEDMVLRIEIEGGTTPMLVYPKQEIIMGRRDPNTGGMPDVDLTSYAGYRMGVSRRHAAVRLQDRQLHVSDLGSSNGTFLNGTRLTAHRPYQLRDGDEVRLGQMVLRLYFQSNKERK